MEESFVNCEIPDQTVSTDDLDHTDVIEQQEDINIVWEEPKKPEKTGVWEYIKQVVLPSATVSIPIACIYGLTFKRCNSLEASIGLSICMVAGGKASRRTSKDKVLASLEFLKYPVITGAVVKYSECKQLAIGVPVIIYICDKIYAYFEDKFTKKPFVE